MTELDLGQMSLDQIDALVRWSRIKILVDHAQHFHERHGDPDLETVLTEDLEQLDTFLLVALVDALKS
jgi:hypothetical protein